MNILLIKLCSSAMEIPGFNPTSSNCSAFVWMILFKGQNSLLKINENEWIHPKWWSVYWISLCWEGDWLDLFNYYCWLIYSRVNLWIDSALIWESHSNNRDIFIAQRGFGPLIIVYEQNNWGTRLVLIDGEEKSFSVASFYFVLKIQFDMVI